MEANDRFRSIEGNRDSLLRELEKMQERYSKLSVAYTHQKDRLGRVMRYEVPLPADRMSRKDKFRLFADTDAARWISVNDEKRTATMWIVSRKKEDVRDES